MRRWKSVKFAHAFSYNRKLVYKVACSRTVSVNHLKQGLADIALAVRRYLKRNILKA